MLFLRERRNFLYLQLSPTLAADIFARVRPALARIRLSAVPADQQVSHRQRARRAGQRAAVTRRSDLDEQRLEVRVAMLVAASLQVQVVMAQLVLDDRFGLFPSMDGQLVRANLDMMALREITSSRRFQPRVKYRFMTKRQSERGQRHFLDPFLQCLIVHVCFFPRSAWTT